MLDFKELPQDGLQFELLVREVLFTKGIDVYWSGIGPDGGKDLLCIERISSAFGPTTRRWLVQCKHFAHANRSVGTRDLDNIVDSARQHAVDGYAVAASTYLSSSLVSRLEAIAADRANHLLTSYIDGALIERQLLTPESVHVAQRFFPDSAIAKSWQVHRTDRPNHFIVSHRGYVFHLINRIGSSSGMHLSGVTNRINDMEKLPFEAGHFLRPRCFWYDDKSGSYTVYLDYMVPNDAQRQYKIADIANALGDRDVMEDGQLYAFEILPRRYSPVSDHYDRDHYEYYVPYMGSFLVGEARSRSTIPSQDLAFAMTFDPPAAIRADGKPIDTGASSAFDDFVRIVREKLGNDVVRAENAYPEALSYINDGNLSVAHDLFGSISGNFLTASIVCRSSARSRVYKMIELFDQGFDCIVSCRDGITFVPGDDNRCKLDDEGPDSRFLFVEFSSPFASNAGTIRDRLNRFFVEAASRVKTSSL